MAAKETKELVLGVAALLKAGMNVKADGKIDLNDLQYLLVALPAVKEAVEGVGAVPQELMSIGSEELEALALEALASLAIGDAKTQKIVLESLKLVLQGWKVVQALKA